MWPEAQLNLWLIIMIASAATILGVFSYFMVVQSRFHLGIPWYVYSTRTLSSSFSRTSAIRETENYIKYTASSDTTN